MVTRVKWRRLVLGLLLCVMGAAALWALAQRRAANGDLADGPVAALRVTSTSFADGAQMPAAFTCDGRNISPALTISAAPTATESFIIIASDLDAPLGFVHWLVFNVPPDALEIPEGASLSPRLLRGAVQGGTDFEEPGYGGPCPPSGTHRYLFRVYALSTTLNLPAGATRPQVAAAARGRVLAEGRIMGLYQRTR